MRSSSSKSRSRSKSSRSKSSLGNVVNRVFDSAGPEGRVRGTPQQVIEKYQTLARDAQLSGDRVAMENFLQHAEHYARMLGESQRHLQAQQAQQAQNGHQSDNGGSRSHHDGESGSSRSGGHSNGHESRPSGGNGSTAQSGGRPEGAGLETIDDGAASDTGLVATPETNGTTSSRSRSTRKPPVEATAEKANGHDITEGAEAPAPATPEDGSTG